MRLSLIRHALAQAKAPHAPGSEGRGDALRALTPVGRERFGAQVAQLTSARWQAARLWSSPWLRALETAQLLEPLCASPLVVVPGLAMDPSQDLMALMRAEQELAAVGHLPWLSQLAAWLVSGSMENAEKWPLGTGDVLVLEGEIQPGGMRVVQRFEA